MYLEIPILENNKADETVRALRKIVARKTPSTASKKPLTGAKKNPGVTRSA